MKKTNFLALALCFTLIMSGCSIFKSGKKSGKNAKNQPAVTATTPPAKPDDKGKNDKAPKAFKDFITEKVKTSYGLFTVYEQDDKYFFEIADSLLGRDLLVVSRISKSAAESRKGFLGYAGDQIGDNVIRFERGPKDKIFLKNISFGERSADSTNMLFSVQNSNIQPIIASFDIKSVRKDTTDSTNNSIIDLTDFINSDNSVLYFNPYVKRSLNIGGQANDRSYINTVKTFPLNVEINVVKTFSQTGGQGQGNQLPPSDPLTYEINSSIVLLPKEPMKARYFDPRVGYFATSYVDFDKNPQGVERVTLITRWRLEPKPEDVEKYLAGELVEPQKPIVFYIDPTTPKKWAKYLKMGVDDWQAAFEQAGFKNAIYALDAPANDSTWSIDDARHSAIVYKPSDIPNASGPHVHDPRSGEIIETHINWYHNVMQLLHDWYFVQVAPLNERAQAVQYDDELMGQLIRFVSSHEVGHTLGLRHNFGSSATVPTEKLRDKAWVEANGHTPSIMDYARFNYVAQPEDNISEIGLFPRIGIYDKWAIEWGYRWFPEYKTPQEEVPFLNKWVMEKLAADKRYTFGTETDGNDPRNQSEDLGDNSMKSSEYGIKNLQRIVPRLFEWTKEENKDFSATQTMYYQILTQFSRYIGHVTKNVGGVMTTPKRVEQDGAVTEFTPAATQKEAMAFLDKNLFTTPEWLISKDLTEKCGIDLINNLSSLQNNVLSRLISRGTIDKLVRYEAINGVKAYTALQMLSDLKKSVWTGKKSDIYSRNLQKSYVNACISMIKPQANGVISMTMNGVTMIDNSRPSDATAIVRAHLTDLRKEIASKAASSTGITKAHFQELTAKIDEALDVKK